MLKRLAQSFDGFLINASTRDREQIMMQNDELNDFVKHILRELDRQSHVLCEMQDLIRNQSVLLKTCQPYDYQKASQEKKRLLDFIKSHNETLLNFKEKWRNIGDHMSVEILESIQDKIDEIASIAQDILSIEKENYLAIKESY